MKGMCTDSRYKNSHKKSVKSCEKYLTRNKVSVKIHSFTASQLHSFTASQLHSFTAEGYLCPNKTITHNQIFSHHTHKSKSPSLCVFYSTTYENGTIHQKQNLIRGFQRGVPFGSAGKRGGHRGRENPALNGVFSPPKRGVNL